jgi:dephospho-CoA kinase
MKNSPRYVGITGGIGSGKSTVTQIFKLLGVPVYDADSMAKRLMEEDEELIDSIQQEFGQEAYSNGMLNRQFLAEKVFKDELLLEKLNAIVHPAIGRHFNSWANQFHDNYILKEAALLFETGSYLELDQIILVQAPLETRIERIKKRDPQRASEQIINIIERQMAVEDANALANYIITNDEANLLIPQVLKLHNQLIKKGLT